MSSCPQMSDDLIFVLTLVSALGCGLMAGLFFAFSVSVMKALARLPSAEGIAAMQSINVAIINPVFLAAFFGTAAACVLIIMIASLLRWHDPGAVYLLIGGAFYLIGTFLVTFVFNVPKNNALATVAPATRDRLGYGLITSRSGQPGTMFGRQRRSRQQHCSPSRSVSERRNRKERYFMATHFTGGCMCGAVRYECEVEPIAMGNCHCRDCQRATGSAFAAAILVPTSTVNITGGEILRSHRR